jgi:hypothetical protein
MPKKERFRTAEAGAAVVTRTGVDCWGKIMSAALMLELMDNRRLQRTSESLVPSPFLAYPNRSARRANSWGMTGLRQT